MEKVAGGFTLALLFVFLSKATSAGEQPISTVLDGDPAVVETQYCYPNYTEKGEIKIYSIAQLLRSSHILDCHSDISSDLVVMFSLSDDGRSRRMETKGSVEDLCPVFVNLTSTVILSGYGKRPGPNLRTFICTEDRLTRKEVEDRDFCNYVSSKRAFNEVIIEQLENRILYSNITKMFRELVSMDDTVCQAKCGDGSKRVLCNSFYSLVSLLSLDSDGNDEKDTVTNSTTVSPTTAATAPPISSAQSSFLSPQKNLSSIISRLTRPILTLPKEDELERLATAAPKSLEFLLGKVEDLQTDLKQELLELGVEEVSVILRMFWIVKIGPERLRFLQKRDWLVILGDPTKRFVTVVWFKNEGIRNEVTSFSNLAEVVRHLYWYQSIVFANLPESWPHKSNIIGDSDQVVLGDGGSRTPLPTDASDKKISFPDTNAPHSGTNDDTQGGPPDTGDDSVDKKLGSDGQEIADSTSEEDHASSKEGLDASKVIQKNGDDDGKYPPFVKKNDKIPSAPASVVPSFSNVNEPEQASNGGPKDTSENSVLKGKNPSDGKSSSKSRSYGPFHFLTLFLVVGGVIVVAYVCMHNRKKFREGLGGYMSGKSKRRRIRDYKPLAVSET